MAASSSLAGAPLPSSPPAQLPRQRRSSGARPGRPARRRRRSGRRAPRSPRGSITSVVAARSASGHQRTPSTGLSSVSSEARRVDPVGGKPHEVVALAHEALLVEEQERRLAAPDPRPDWGVRRRRSPPRARAGAPASWVSPGSIPPPGVNQKRLSPGRAGSTSRIGLVLDQEQPILRVEDECAGDVRSGRSLIRGCLREGDGVEIGAAQQHRRRARPAAAGRRRTSAPPAPPRRRARRRSPVAPERRLRGADRVVARPAPRGPRRSRQMRVDALAGVAGAERIGRHRVPPRRRPARRPRGPRGARASPPARRRRPSRARPTSCAMPLISPPPPTATSTVSRSGASSSHSSADRALARDGRLGVERMDAQRAGLGDIAVAGLLRVGVAGAADHHLGAVRADDRDLRGARDLRHEDARLDAELPRRIGDRRAVIAARRRRDARLRAPCCDSSVLKAPRALNEPACCRNSSLRLTGPS